MKKNKYIIIEDCVKYSTIENTRTIVFDTYEEARNNAIKMANETCELLKKHEKDCLHYCSYARNVYLMENNYIHTAYVILPIEI